MNSRSANTHTISASSLQRTVVIDLADKLGAVLGKGGATIRGISESSGARLDIDKETNSITITGQPDEVAAAEKAIKLILVPPPPESIMRRELEPRMIAAVLGNKGATIRYAVLSFSPRSAAFDRF